LTDAQRKKLHVAGQGDIKRALDRYSAVHRRDAKANDAEHMILRLNQEEAELARDLDSGIFGRGSLFSKVMATTITEGQARTAHERHRKEQWAGYRASVVDVAASLAPALGLADEQRQKLESLLLEEIPAPRELGESNRPHIMYHFFRLPETKVRPIFDDAQWRLLREVRRSWETRPSFWSKAGVEGVAGPAKADHTHIR
jgi:hypothetical protein